MASQKEKTLRIALNTAKQAGRKWAAKRAIRLVKKDIQKHSRAPLEKIKLAKEVNERIWENGSYNLPSRIELDIVPEKEGVIAFLHSGKEKAAFLESKKTKEKPKEKKPKPVSETKEEQEQALEQQKKLEEKRLKEEAAQKAEFK